VSARASLRELARRWVSGTPWLSISDLAAARERLSRGDVAFLGFRNGALECLGWLGTRSEITSASEGGAGSHLPLPGPTSVIEAHPGPDDPSTAGVVQALIVEMSGAAAGEEIWLVVDARQSAWRTAARRLGLSTRCRLGRSWLLRRSFRAWVQVGEPPAGPGA